MDINFSDVNKRVECVYGNRKRLNLLIFRFVSISNIMNLEELCTFYSNIYFKEWKETLRCVDVEYFYMFV